MKLKCTDDHRVMVINNHAVHRSDGKPCSAQLMMGDDKVTVAEILDPALRAQRLAGSLPFNTPGENKKARDRKKRQVNKSAGWSKNAETS